MKKINELAIYLGETRKAFELFDRNEAAMKCGVTEMTIRNFESGKAVNPQVLLYYLAEASRFYNDGGKYSDTEEFSDLYRHDMEECSMYAKTFCLDGFVDMINYVKGE